MRRVLVLRQTCRHARETISPHPSIVHTKDGRWVMANLGTRPGEAAALVGLLERHGIEAGLDMEKGVVGHGSRFVPGTAPVTGKRDLAMEAVQRFVRAFTYDNVPWREAQEAGMLWAPLRKPHENAMDPHWLARRSCTDVEHPELVAGVENHRAEVPALGNLELACNESGSGNAGGRARSHDRIQTDTDQYPSEDWRPGLGGTVRVAFTGLPQTVPDGVWYAVEIWAGAEKGDRYRRNLVSDFRASGKKDHSHDLRSALREPLTRAMDIAESFTPAGLTEAYLPSRARQ